MHNILYMQAVRHYIFVNWQDIYIIVHYKYPHPYSTRLLIIDWLLRLNAWPSVYKPFTKTFQPNPKLVWVTVSVSSALCSRTETVRVLFVEDLHTAAVNAFVQQTFGLSVQHQLCLFCFYCCWRNMLNKKARSNQGENATPPPWGLGHLYLADDGEKSNENKWAAPGWRSVCLEGTWPTNDINTFIEMR